MRTDPAGKAVFLIRRKGDRTEGEGPNLTPLWGDPVSSSCPAVPQAWLCRSVLGQLEGVGWAWAQCPDDWTGAAWATSPGLKEEGRTSRVQPSSPTPHYCVWGENRLSNYGNLELGLPGTRPLLPPECGSGFWAFLSPCPLSLMEAVSARPRTGEANHLSWIPCFTFH